MHGLAIQRSHVKLSAGLLRGLKRIHIINREVSIAPSRYITPSSRSINAAPANRILPERATCFNEVSSRGRIRETSLYIPPRLSRAHLRTHTRAPVGQSHRERARIPLYIDFSRFAKCTEANCVKLPKTRSRRVAQPAHPSLYIYVFGSRITRNSEFW